jgi:dTMP kinase
MVNTGKLIVFEGVEGVGKSTQLEFVADYLRGMGHDVLTTFEPGGTTLGGALRNILLNTDEEIDDVTELLLFAADRNEHIKSVIIPALANGKIVLCDRFIYSTIAYQGFGRLLNNNIINELNSIVTCGLEVDLVLWFDLPLTTALARTGKNKDRIEAEKLDFFERVLSGYQAVWQFYQNVKRIDASGNKREVFDKIILSILKVLRN